MGDKYQEDIRLAIREVTWIWNFRLTCIINTTNIEEVICLHGERNELVTVIIHY